MDANNTSYSDSTEAVISELARLIEEGWTERQIAYMVRKRATYSSTSDSPPEPPAPVLSRAEQDHLEFTRWLYNSGRMSS